MLIDRFAYNNRWCRVHPGEKGLFVACGMTAALLSASPWLPMLIGLLMALLTVVGARIPLRFYLRMLLLPAGFLMIGVVGLAVSFSAGDIPLLRVPVIDLPLSLTYEGLNQAGLVLSRSLASVCCLYLLALTTPMTGVLSLLRRLRVPELMLELAVIAYRQLFVFFQVAREMRLSQTSRLGYSSVNNSFRSLGLLAGNLFLRVHQRSRLLYRSLQSRGYDNQLCWLEEDYPLSKRNLFIAGLAGAGLLTWAICFRVWL